MLLASVSVHTHTTTNIKFENCLALHFCSAALENCYGLARERVTDKSFAGGGAKIHKQHTPQAPGRRQHKDMVPLLTQQEADCFQQSQAITDLHYSALLLN